MAGFVDRVIGAARLSPATYEEVEADAGATGQAALVVVLSSVAAGFASWPKAGLAGMVATAVVALLGWYVWALIAYAVGTRLLPGPATEANLGQVLRTTGFSAGPGLLRLLGVVPGLAWLASVVAALWMLVAMVVAVRQALDYERTGRALLVCLVGFVVYATLVWVVALVLATAVGSPSAGS